MVAIGCMAALALINPHLVNAAKESANASNQA